MTDEQIRDMSEREALELAGLLPEKFVAREPLGCIRKIGVYETYTWTLIFRGERTGNLYQEVRAGHPPG